MTKSLPEAKLRLRMSSQDAHYAGNLVDGARILNLIKWFTEITIKNFQNLIITVIGKLKEFRTYLEHL